MQISIMTLEWKTDDDSDSPDLWALRNYALGPTPLELVEVRTVARHAVFRFFLSHRFFFARRELNGLRSAPCDSRRH